MEFFNQLSKQKKILLLLSVLLIVLLFVAYMKSTALPVKSLEALPEDRAMMEAIVRYNQSQESSHWWGYLMFLLGGLLGGYILFGRKNSIKEPAQSHTHASEQSATFAPTSSTVRFDDIVGVDEVKNQLLEIVDFLKMPQKFSHFGARMPKGILMAGRPGVGKTLLSKALANEAGVPFFYQSGAAFAQRFVGSGPQRVEALFMEAKRLAPSIVFIDEIDAIGKQRGGWRNDEREATLNELLTQMDGFESSSGVIVIGATNKIEMLDEALLRPGRFDRRIHIGLPALSERQAILSHYLKSKPHNLDIELLAKTTVGFSAAALETLVNEAALQAIRNHSHYIGASEIDQVRHRVIGGQKPLLHYSDSEKELLSLHQGAKAIAAVALGIDFEKITLVDTTLIEPQRHIESQEEIERYVLFYLSGIAAVEQHYKQRYSNASDDIDKAKHYIEQLIQNQMDNSEPSQQLKKLFERTQSLVASLERPILGASRLMLKKELIGFDEAKNLTQERY